jgi:hypothetical protein
LRGIVIRRHFRVYRPDLPATRVSKSGTAASVRRTAAAPS